MKVMLLQSQQTMLTVVKNIVTLALLEVHYLIESYVNLPEKQSLIAWWSFSIKERGNLKMEYSSFYLQSWKRIKAIKSAIEKSTN